MKKILFTMMVAATLAACNNSGTKEAVLTDFSDSASYAVGISIGSNLAADFKAQGVDSSFSSEILLAGLQTLSAKSKMTQEEAQDIVGRFFENLNTERANKNKAKGDAFLKENGSKPGVVTTESGLQYIVLNEGQGATPTTTDQVRVHYTGKLMNGEVFDSSIERNEPVVFYVRSVIPGWTEALQLMKEGAEYKLFIPGNLAYGEQGNPRGGIGPNEVLIFDVKLIDVIKE